MTAQVEYKGNLRTDCLHLASNQKIITDAPIDNHGKGEAFSPTDLMATSAAACLITVMGIKAESLDVNLEKTKILVKKVMSENAPRRIVQINLDIHIPLSLDKEKKELLEETGRTCPVLLSISEKIVKNVNFHWNSLN